MQDCRLLVLLLVLATLMCAREGINFNNNLIFVEFWRGKHYVCNARLDSIIRAYQWLV